MPLDLHKYLDADLKIHCTPLFVLFQEFRLYAPYTLLCYSLSFQIFFFISSAAISRSGICFFLLINCIFFFLRDLNWNSNFSLAIILSLSRLPPAFRLGQIPSFDERLTLALNDEIFSLLDNAFLASSLLLFFVLCIKIQSNFSTFFA